MTYQELIAKFSLDQSTTSSPYDLVVASLLCVTVFANREQWTPERFTQELYNANIRLVNQEPDVNVRGAFGELIRNIEPYMPNDSRILAHVRLRLAL